jgi:hypothetical protein
VQKIDEILALEGMLRKASNLPYVG